MILHKKYYLFIEVNKKKLYMCPADIVFVTIDESVNKLKKLIIILFNKHYFYSSI
jgi:hypothetical protein